MDTEMRLRYIESERSIEAERILRVAHARALSSSVRQTKRPRVDTLSRVAAILRTRGWHRRAAPAAPKPTGVPMSDSQPDALAPRFDGRTNAAGDSWNSRMHPREQK